MGLWPQHHFVFLTYGPFLLKYNWKHSTLWRGRDRRWCSELFVPPDACLCAYLADAQFILKYHIISSCFNFRSVFRFHFVSHSNTFLVVVMSSGWIIILYNRTYNLSIWLDLFSMFVYLTSMKQSHFLCVVGRRFCSTLRRVRKARSRIWLLSARFFSRKIFLFLVQSTAP